LIDTQLIQQAKTAEPKVFYHKMKGDYYRYISEFTTGAENTKAGDNAYNAYKAATESAEQ
jgi:14-3-3 protein epsilon